MLQHGARQEGVARVTGESSHSSIRPADRQHAKEHDHLRVVLRLCQHIATLSLKKKQKTTKHSFV